MELIHIDIGVLKLKLSHVVGLLTFVFITVAHRGIHIEKRFFLCFVGIFISILISSLCSPWVVRGCAYSVIWVFTFFSFFVIPFNMMQFFDENKLIQIYIATFLIIGSYAALQFFSSFAGIVLPFSVQKVIFVRGSGMALEPSFYALYAIPFVTFLNSRWLLSRAYIDRTPRTSFKSVFFANLFLLVSTATSAFISYFVFLFVAFCLRMNPRNQKHFSGIRKKILKATMGFFGFFALMSCLFFELFKRTFLKFFYYGLNHESFIDRFKGITGSFNLFLEHPFFGVGLGGVGPSLFQERFFPGYDGQITELDRVMLENFEPTNVVTEILGSLGILGFAAFSLLIFLILRSFRKLLDDQRLLPAERINVMSFLISIIVTLICLQINQGLFRGYVWVHLGVGAGYVMKIQSMLRQREP